MGNLKIIRGRHPSKRLLEAQSKAFAAKKASDIASSRIGSLGGLTKATIKGMPAAVGKIGSSIFQKIVRGIK